MEELSVYHLCDLGKELYSWVAHSPLLVFAQLDDRLNDVLFALFFSNCPAYFSNVAHDGKSDLGMVVFDELSNDWDEVIYHVFRADHRWDEADAFSQGCSHVDWRVTDERGRDRDRDCVEEGLSIAFSADRYHSVQSFTSHFGFWVLDELFKEGQDHGLNLMWT